MDVAYSATAHVPSEQICEIMIYYTHHRCCSSTCTCWCFFKFLPCWKDLSHLTPVYDQSPVCLRRCTSTL